MAKGIILAGGSGTRLSPVTFSINKHLIPIYNKPMIHYPLSSLMLLDIKEVLIICNPNDIDQFRALYGEGKELGIEIDYEIQANPNGLAEAFIIGEDFLEGEDAVLILGDNIFFGNGFYNLGKGAIDSNTGATLFAYPVKDPERFGVIEMSEEGNVLSLEEKPKNPKSNFIATGLYVYDKNVSKIAKTLKPSARGELEITDLNNIYLAEGLLKVKALRRGFAWFDVGTFSAFNEASILIKQMESLHSSLIGSPEEISFSKKWIDREQFKKLIEKHAKSEYAEILRNELAGGK